MKKYLFVKEASVYLNKSASSVYDYCRKGKIKSFRFGGFILVDKKSCFDFLELSGLK